ncbi:CBASS oligonucleotide cyclase [Gottfriedia acidiceleris]|uniref:Nucleotidyltransferase n=1 Tax=Gottfriedia acidiceleris TaxID=371036 RepID=A0ABY4JL18_9BACI|nr:CBASS oligonucleotide cyclase [Gottfriedia acidiceleris]UPM54529.1 nucleotidyltransferase [Gottfriedia acidiceleris]
MGGSGGWYVPGQSLSDLLKDQAMQQQKENERAINDYLQSLLAELNNRDTKQVQLHLNTLINAIEKDIDGTVDLLFGGSMSKHTYAQGLSDVDMLVRINNSELANSKPQEVLDYFVRQIQSRLPRTEVKKGDLAVTVKFKSGYEIQLLPSIKTATGYKIAKPGINEWSNVIKPRRFAEKLTSVNKSNGGKVIPMIKLFKSINDQFPKKSQLSGYHIESLAIEAFKSNQTFPKTVKEALQKFCQHSRSAVLSPIKDSTGQSLHVDDYLGVKDSISRQRVSNNFRILEKKLNNASSIDEWKDILGK